MIQTRNMILATSFKAAREASGFSLRQLSKIIGVEHTTLHRFEKGQEIEGSKMAKILRWLLDHQAATKRKTKNTK